VKTWRIVQVDLLKPVLSLPSETERAYVYFWCQGLLLDRKIFASSELPLSSIEPRSL
jgi:hypothetical protein